MINFISHQPGAVEPINLYANDVKDNLRVYTISCEGYEIKTSSGLILGAKNINREFIDYGKSSRSRHEQVLSRMTSIINKQVDKGYCFNMEDTIKPRTNSLGFLKPMKAIGYTDARIKRLLQIGSELYLQPKYNGHRCVIVREGSEVIAYSSGGKQIKTLDHLLHDIQIPEGVPFDGELYIHGMRLQDIESRVKKLQDETHLLKFVCFDVMIKENFPERNAILQETEFYKKNVDRIVKVSCHSAENLNDVKLYFDTCIAANYEGAMIRVGDIHYEDGKRSSSIIKMKRFFDKEFKILKIGLSEKGIPTARCQNDITDVQFSVTLPGSHHEKHMLYLKGVELVGKYMTVKFPERYASGKPAQPVALQIREDM